MRGNRKGPENKGPKTGRGLGYLNDRVIGGKARPEGGFGHKHREQSHREGELSD
jgi:hypothetical protein